MPLEDEKIEGLNEVTEIAIIRHGETDWNVGEVFRGRIDIGLNETGVKQAELLAEYLGGSKIAAVYSSPLKRALKTAEMVAGYHNLDIEVAPGLIDFDYGEWQGLSHQVVREGFKKLYAEWRKSPHRVRIPGGESLDDVRVRATGFVADVVAGCQGTVVLISHRVVNKVLICALLGLDNSHFWNIRQDNCGVTTFTYQDECFILTKHNDTSFLASMRQARLADF